MRPAALVYTPRFAEYDLGPSHPLRPVRVQRTYELIRACGLLEKEGVFLARPTPVDEETLALVHSAEYINAVRAPGERRAVRRPIEYGLGTADNPIVPNMYEAAALVVGGSVLAADLVVRGKAAAAFNPSGGLHHAHRARAAGFCIFNDAAVAIEHIARATGGGVKIAYVDIDAHHGDGVQEAFYSRRDVMTISVHETGRYLFPGTGGVDEVGEGEGEGFSVNLPLSPQTTDDVYLWAFREIVPPLLEAFEPDFVVSQLGADTHFRDPLTHMCLTTRGYDAVVAEIAARARRWVAVGGGGYDVSVVPRAWTLAFARMLGEDAPESIPQPEAKHYGGDGSVPLHDTTGPRVDDEWARIAREFAQQAVEAVKERVFPYHGLA